MTLTYWKEIILIFFFKSNIDSFIFNVQEFEILEKGKKYKFQRGKKKQSEKKAFQTEPILKWNIEQTKNQTNQRTNERAIKQTQTNGISITNCITIIHINVIACLSLQNFLSILVELTCPSSIQEIHWIFDLQWFQFAQMIYWLFGGYSISAR